jgi:flagellar protein FlaJ
MEEEKDNQKRIMIIVSAMSACLIVAGMALGDPAILGNLIIISIFLTAVPYFFFKYSRYLWVKSLEIEFPNFVRDLADSVRSMPLPEALAVVSRSNYGNLTFEVKKMHNRMSWGTPFLRTLEIFEDKVRNSRLISEALGILKQSYESGGNMANTLDSISRDLLMLREADQERASMLRQHIVVMYAIFFMFLGIAIMIIMVMVPMIETQSTMSSGGFQAGTQIAFTNPCRPEGMMIFPCGLYMAIVTLFGIPFEGVGAYYVALFFSSIIMQGVFIGLITGQLGENSVTAGIKHSMIMAFSSIAIFLFLAKVGIMPL